MSDCVIFKGGKRRDGYGYLYVRAGGRRRQVLAHRWAWEREYGSIPEGMCVCHHCDNPPCINVEHLFVGTHAENMADMVAKGRRPPGESVNTAKLTTRQVQEIRALVGNASQREIAEQFRVSPSLVSRIVRREHWRHI